MTELTGWWDVAQKIGSGAAFVLGIGIYFVWRAYTGEVKYSKERDRQTLEMLMKLTTVIDGMEKRDEKAAATHDETKRELLAAIGDLKETIVTHFARTRK